MTRLANQEKAGYFPLPPSVTDLILSHISAPHGGRIYDPCAGEGTALVALAEALSLSPFGVELHEERAQAARQQVESLLARRLTVSRSAKLPVKQTRILHDSFLNAKTSRDGFNLLYLNPPYDHDSEEGRLEYKFLMHLRPFLQPDGLLVYVIPQHVLNMRKLAAYIVSHFQDMRVFRFPDDTYEQFKQIVLFAMRRAKAVAPDPGDVAQLRGYARGESSLLVKENLPPLVAAPEPLYTLPSLLIKDNAFRFRSFFVDPADALAEAKEVGVCTTEAWRDHLDPSRAQVSLRPLTPLKIGHMNGIIASGFMNNQVLEARPEPNGSACTDELSGSACTELSQSDGDGLSRSEGDERLLIKGRSYKATRMREYEESLPDGKTKVTEEETEVVVTDITTIDPAGQVVSHNGPGLERFLQKWIGNLTDVVAKDYPPVYQFNMNGYSRIINRLSKQRPIPGMVDQNGRSKSGLLPAQKHATAAALTRLETENDVIIIGEMGTGKTTIAAAIAAGRNAQRTIVLCPPHLVDKWQREFKAVWPDVRTMHLQSIRDVDIFFGLQPDNAPLVGVLKQTSARSASGWEHAYDFGGAASHKYGSQGATDIQRGWGDVLAPYHLLRMGADEKTAPAHTKDTMMAEVMGDVLQMAGIATDVGGTKESGVNGIGDQAKFAPANKWQLSEKQIQALSQRGIRCPVCGETQFRAGRPLGVGELKSAATRCMNDKCRSPLYQFTRRRSDSQQRGSFKVYAQRERIIRSYTDKGLPVPEHEVNKWQGTTIKDTFGYGKVPLASYIKKHAQGGLLDLLIVDEVHQYKGFDSDQGYAMHHLALAADKVVAMTGTIYGGKASSLFYLLFRLSPEMRQAYVDPEARGQGRVKHKEWTSAYGILQRIETRTLDEDGKQTANSRSNVRYKELPGGSPAMLPWLLNRSVFLSLGDMGFPLPEYTEIPISVAMAPEQAVRYEALKDQLVEELKERLVRGDKSLLAGYLYALLFWPDSPRRAKVVTCPRSGNVVASVPGLPEAFIGPKEEEIIELCLAEKEQGRRAILFCQQTDTLDIQPEWKKMLESHGLKTAILRTAPNKREAWVAKQVAAGVDVIITHPRKVETGIDLLDFPTLIWMAPDYSVYTVLQASRRSWRIGQTEPVKVYFFCYEDTIQEDALHLVAAKVAATLRVNGDSVDDDSLAELDQLTGGDLISTLAKIVTGDVQIEARSLQAAFAEANADFRAANAIIGDYTIEDDEEEDEQEVVQPVVIQGLVAAKPSALSKRSLLIPGPTNRSSPQASLFADACTNGDSVHNGYKNGGGDYGNGCITSGNGSVLESIVPDLEEPDGEALVADLLKPPPVPRPRVLSIC